MKRAIFTILFLFTISSLFAAFNMFGIPDSSEIRRNLEEKWFTAPLSEIRSYMPEVFTNENGEKFQVRLEEDENTFNVFVAPHTVINVHVVSDKEDYYEKQDVYPGDYSGSWVLIRDKKSEKPLRIRYYFMKDSGVFIQFTPNGKTALADLVIYGNYAARGVPTGMPFDKFFSASFADVMDITETKLPWKYVKIDTDMYHSMKQMCAVIDEKLPKIQIVPDAMYDENDELVHISTGKQLVVENQDKNSSKISLSSAGFIKWIADGLVEPMSHALIKREPLIRETVEVKDIGRQGILSQKYSLYFALDWIRNLASAVISAYSDSTYLFNQSGVDVTISPFASSITEKGVANTVTFVSNSGYTTSVLRSLMYVLAATEPGTLYFGAIRGTDRTVSPEIMAFNECAAFFPYFEDDGGFKCYVYINGKKKTLEDFCMYYSGDFVYLTKVKSSEQFFPK